ncbi:sugar transporter ERD6-like 6 [Lathyrus oleraceus]|uniref:sugar transporter ERD6-like 6 n=1 Tax=Pisum sativum TaxID=3888 RepID=UPI0021D1FDBF|nr:sugar transporter ERD6-like 6 [Pisum sativum]
MCITLDNMYKEYVGLFSEHGEEGSGRTNVDQNGLILEPHKSSGWLLLMNYVEEQQAILVVKYEIKEYLSEINYKPKDNGIRNKPKLADKSGRRLLLIVSSSAMALSLLVVSISFYLKEYISPDSDLYATLSLVSVAGVVVMVIAFSLGLGAMPWIIMSEILPINIKGLAGSFATLANWFFSWLVTLTANLLLDWSSGGTFTIYTAVCVFTAGFVAIWVPETKGKTLEEIQQFFR